MAATIWEAWQDVRDDRLPAFGGVATLTHTAIKDYIEVSGAVLARWEVKALKELDRVYRSVIND